MLERRPLISLCMIVKDEADQLPRCLGSVRGIADELVVVDTGSSDDTAAIAEAHGARIVHDPWRGDFAAARNAGVERARGEWILFLDADEALDPAQGEELRQVAAQCEDEGLFLEIHNYVGDGRQGATVNPVLRMFRNRPAYRFEGRIHEQIAASILAGKPDASFRLTGFVVHHYGYQQARVEAKGKVERNMRLLEEALTEEPDNAFYHYNLGVEYLRTGRPEPALAHFREASARIDPVAVSYAHLVAKYEVRCLQGLGRWSEAADRANEALLLYPDYTDLVQYKAASELALGREAEAARSLVRAMELGRAPSPYHTEDGIGTYQTAYLLGELMEARGDIDEALLWYREAVRLRASLTPPLYRAFQLLRISGREREIVPWIKEGFRPTSPEAWVKLLAIALTCRCEKAATELLRERDVRRLPQGVRRLAEAEAALLGGRPQTARERLSAADGQARKAQDAQSMQAAFAEQLRWLSGAANGPWRDPLAAALAGEEGALDRLAAAGPDWPRLRLLLEGSAASGKADRYGRILAVWQDAMSLAGDAGPAARELVLGLTAVADRHLALATADESDEDERAALISLRLRLPMEQGF